jgi:hypothetical protein
MAIPASLSLQSTPNSFDYAAVVTISDTTVLPLTRGLLVTHSTAGAVVVTMSNGDNCTFNWHGATTIILPIRCTKVLSTGTTAAANFVALY